jgi:hypothetical protein
MIVGNKSFTDRFVPGGIFVYTIATRSFRSIVDDAAGARWLNDNRRLVYPDSGTGKIFVVDTRSAQRHEILSVAPRELGAIRITADNATLYYHVATTESDIWRVGLPEGASTSN